MNECWKVKVNKQVLVLFFIRIYNDKVLCVITPKHTSHLIFKRLLQFDRKVVHDGFKNMFENVVTI